MNVREFDNVEYTQIPDRQPVSAFVVGDRIGSGEPMLILKSEEDPNDSECWILHWKKPDGSIEEWEGDKDQRDVRWYQSLYVIQEIP